LNQPCHSITPVEFSVDSDSKPIHASIMDRILGASLGLYVSLLTFGPAALAQDAKKAAGADTKETPPLSSAEKPKPASEELEAKFKATLTKATLSGRWCAIKDGQLGPEKEDKYTILSVAKVTSDLWLINARIQYGQKDIVAPIPVRVKWAGDTPVIVVDDVGLPGGNTYSARVLIYEKTYAGTWSGGDHGGLLNGVITNQKE
jgi:hypothetical protein